MRKLLGGVALAGMLALVAGDLSAKEWTKLRIAVEGAYPPFSEVSPEGKLEGFDVDIAEALCAQMKVECTLVQQDWDGMIPGLLARKYDAIVASMTITEERKKAVDFTGKYYHTPAKFIARKDSGIEISKEGLKGKRIGVQRATTHENYVTDNFGDVAEVVRYGTQDEAYLDLEAGRVDLLLADSVAVKVGFLDTEKGQAYAFVGPDLRDPKWFGEGAGIALRKGEDELRQMLDEAIGAIRADGTYGRIADEYFDFDVYGS